MPDNRIEVFLVWDAGRGEHGEAPDLMAVFVSIDDAIDYAKKAFESDAWDDCVIEQWITGADRPQKQYTLAQNQEQN